MIVCHSRRDDGEQQQHNNNKKEMAEKWRFLMQRIVDAVVNRFHPGQQTFESEANYFEVELERIISASPERVWEVKENGKRYKMILEISSLPKIFLPEYKEVLAQPPELKQVHALYPCEAQYRCLSTQMEMEVEMLHKRYIEAGDGETEQWSLDYVEAFSVLTKRPVLTGGIYCRLGRTGMMCNEDPDDPKCYYIHDGVKKVVEAHTTRRGSFPYVFFASDSVINTGDANQNGNGKNVLIQCDYRPLNEYWKKNGTAVHFYLAVPDAAKHRRSFEELMAQRPAAQDVGVDVYAHRHTYLSTGGVDNAMATRGSVEYDWLSIAIQTLATVKISLSLPTLFAMLGVSDKDDMLQLILPFYTTTTTNIQLSQPQSVLVTVAKRLLAQVYDQDVSKSSNTNIIDFLHSHRDDIKVKQMYQILQDPTAYINPFLQQTHSIQHAANVILSTDGHGREITLADIYVYYAYQTRKPNAVECLKRLFESLNSETFLNVGVDNFIHFPTLIGKQRLLGHIVHKILCVYTGLIKVDDVDHLGMKRAVSIGSMATTVDYNEFKEGLQNLSKDISNVFKKQQRYSVRDLLRRSNVKAIFEPLPFYSPMSTGKMSLIKNAPDTTGVVQTARDFGGDGVNSAGAIASTKDQT